MSGVEVVLVTIKIGWPWNRILDIDYNNTQRGASLAKYALRLPKESVLVNGLEIVCKKHFFHNQEDAEKACKLALMTIRGNESKHYVFEDGDRVSFLLLRSDIDKADDFDPDKEESDEEGNL